MARLRGRVVCLSGSLHFDSLTSASRFCRGLGWAERCRGDDRWACREGGSVRISISGRAGPGRLVNCKVRRFFFGLWGMHTGSCQPCLAQAKFWASPQLSSRVQISAASRHRQLPVGGIDKAMDPPRAGGQHNQPLRFDVPGRNNKQKLLLGG